MSSYEPHHLKVDENGNAEIIIFNAIFIFGAFSMVLLHGASHK
jgi:hypothetical protein